MKKYGRPFGIGYRLSAGEFVLETVVGSEPMSGPKSGIGFLFEGPGREYSSKEEMDVVSAATGLPYAYVGDDTGWYSDMSRVVAVVGETNPDAVRSLS